MNKKRIKITIPVIITKEEDVCLAKCEGLNVDSFGKTVEEAKENLIEAINLYFDTAKDIGTLKIEIKKLVDSPKCRFTIENLKPTQYLTPLQIIPHPTQHQYAYA